MEGFSNRGTVTVSVLAFVIIINQNINLIKLHRKKEKNWGFMGYVNRWSMEPMFYIDESMKDIVM